MKKNLFIIMFVLVLVLFTGCGKKEETKSNEEELVKNLETLGKTFYEEYYFPYLASTEDFEKTIESLSNTGIKVDLENISRVDVVDQNLVEQMVNSKTKEKCNQQNSSVTIYPKSPYSKTDYEINTDLDCGFKKEN